MKKTIVQLIATLETETDCYRQMNQLLDDEQASITLSANSQFDRLQQEKEALVIKLQALEDNRRHLVDGFNAASSPDGQPRTVSQLAQGIEPPYDHQLLTSAKRLRSLIEAVQRKNRRNQKLINENLDLIKGALKLLSDLIDGSPVYQRPGVHHATVGFKPGGGRFVRGTV
jgi:flagellar biosynthesis/type III secretory pathway chaperone